MPTFFRLSTDRVVSPANLDNAFAGPTPSTAWLVGGGPSLAEMNTADIVTSPWPRMLVNLAGTRLLRPTFWTSYDPTARFHKSIYLDPGIMKFVHRRRAMDLVPDCTFKVCECPNTWFFDRQPDASFQKIVGVAGSPVVDWADSLIQAIDILHRLGFRRVFLAGCELHIQPSEAQQNLGRQFGIVYQPYEPLGQFVQRCESAGIQTSALEAAGTGPQYHFDEVKPLASAIQTDLHYYRVVQWLRLSRQALSLAGMSLVSVTPNSRLNDFFPHLSATEAVEEALSTVGNPQTEPTRGLYTQHPLRVPTLMTPMRDFPPFEPQTSAPTVRIIEEA